MKSLISSLVLIVIMAAFTGRMEVHQQEEDPITFVCEAVQVDTLDYEVQIKAVAKMGWYLPSQHQQDSSTAPATIVRFFRNPVVRYTGPTEEINSTTYVHNVPVPGRYRDRLFSDFIVFIQPLRIKPTAGYTTIRGTIEYAPCSKTGRLAVRTYSFSAVIAPIIKRKKNY